MSRLIAVTAAIAAFALPATAIAADTNEWQSAKTLENDDVVLIASGTEQEHGVFFNCADGNLTAGLTTVPGDILEMMAQETSRSKSHDIAMTIGDSEPFKAGWTYFPSLKVAIAHKELTAKKLYNAAIKGETVTWKMPARPEISVTMPEANEAFKAFANDCPVTNPNKQS
ncbi:hypothetical protein [Henriciella sp.]|uniref:hypothetical protein n=1 Tax=Henriciella sp. TaxID=1968823 RepID=UPI002627B6DB|nr:hypothetical protein [Henriciella sp.]